MDGNPIIAGTDGSEDSLRAVEWAAREAVRRTVALRVVSAPELPPRMSPGPAGSQTVAGLVVEGTREALASAAERAAEVARGLTIDTELLSGPPGSITRPSARMRGRCGLRQPPVGGRQRGRFPYLLAPTMGFSLTGAGCRP